MNKSEQLNELAGALAKAQGSMVAATKDTENPFFKSSYADLASVWEVIRKPLSDNGLSVLQSLDYRGNVRVLETILLHTSGQYISSYLDLTPKDASSQAIGSAITYARRYALSALVGVCAEDDDGEGAMGRISPTQKTQVKPEPKPVAKPAVIPSPKARPIVSMGDLPKELPGSKIEETPDLSVPATVSQRQALIQLAKGREQEVKSLIFDNWGKQFLKDLNQAQAVELEKILTGEGEDMEGDE